MPMMQAVSMTPVLAAHGAEGSEPAIAASQPNASQHSAALRPAQEAICKAIFDGSEQKYLVCLPQQFESSIRHDLMIALHGHGSDRRQYAHDPRGECRGARDVAGRHGMIFISPDYRATTSWMGPAAEADMVQLIGELKERHKIGRVFLVGGSMGGTAVLTFAARNPKLVDGVSSQNGMANLLEYDVNFAGIDVAIKDSFGGRKDETPAQYKQRCPQAYLERSAESHPESFTMPLAITVGSDDAIVPPASVLRLAERVRRHNPNVLVIDRPKGGHATSYEDTVAAIEFIVSAASSGSS